MDLNWLAIFIAAIVNVVIGAFWYSPKIFGNEWMRLSNFSMESCKDSCMWQMFACAFALALIMSWVLSLVIDYAGAYSFIMGAVVGFLMWLGFVGTTLFSSVLWEKRPFKLFLINAACQLVTLILMGGIIGVMG